MITRLHPQNTRYSLHSTCSKSSTIHKSSKIGLDEKFHTSVVVLSKLSTRAPPPPSLLVSTMSGSWLPVGATQGSFSTKDSGRGLYSLGNFSRLLCWLFELDLAYICKESKLSSFLRWLFWSCTQLSIIHTGFVPIAHSTWPYPSRELFFLFSFSCKPASCK